MKNIPDTIKIVERELTDDRLNRLYPPFSNWVDAANDQGIKAKEKYTIGALTDKTAAEYVETRRAIRRYFLTEKEEYLKAHANQALEEIGDLANMTLILLPNFSDEKIPLKKMIISLYNYLLDMGINPCYSTNFKAGKKREFIVWLKNIEAIAQYRKSEVGNEYSNSEFNRLSNMVEEEFNKIDGELKYKIDEKNSRQDIVSSIGRIVNYALLFTSIIPVTYENFFESATEKMKQRDARYHGISRLDERGDTKK